MPDKPKVPQGKKLPKWAIPVGAVAVVGIVLLLKKKQGATEGNATEPGTSGLSNQSFIPVTGENVAGVGASGGGGTVEGGGGGGEALRELIKSNQESQDRQQEAQNNFFEHIIEKLGTGGGAPSSPAPAGSVSSPPPESQPASAPTVAPPTPAPAPPPAPKPAGCPPSFPKQGPHGCYHDITCGNGCAGHRYQNGTAECQVKSGGKCHW